MYDMFWKIFLKMNSEILWSVEIPFGWVLTKMTTLREMIFILIKKFEYVCLKVTLLCTHSSYWLATLFSHIPVHSDFSGHPWVFELPCSIVVWIKHLRVKNPDKMQLDYDMVLEYGHSFIPILLVSIYLLDFGIALSCFQTLSK